MYPMRPLGASALRMFEEVKILKRNGYKIDFLFVVGLDTFIKYIRDKKRWLFSIREELDQSKVFVTPRFPHDTNFLLKTIFVMANTLICLITFSFIGGNKRYKILHAHTNIFGYYSCIIRKFTGLTNFYDCHGVRYEEVKLSKGQNYSRLSYNLDKIIEKYTLRNSSEIIAVSEKMRDYMKRMATVKPSLVPMGIDPNAGNFDHSISSKLRRMLDLSEKKVIIYCGNYARYQCFDQMKILFYGLKKISENYHFIVLVPATDKKKVLNYFKDHEDLPISVLSVKHRDVKYLLAASDLGLMLREDSIVNKVASPTKFSEYLVCGLPVIATRFIGDVSEFIVDNDAGMILDLDKLSDENYINKVEQKIDNLINIPNKELNSKRLKNLAIKNRSWDICTKELVNLYHKHS